MLSYKVLLRFQKNSVSKDIDSIYLLFYHFDNEFYKNTKILHISLLFGFEPCNKEKKKIELNDAQLPKSTLPVMKPLKESEPKLTAQYIQTKKGFYRLFYKKNWPNNSANGSFLVAKNGQIIYEQYEGYSNFRAKTLITKSTPPHCLSE
jgi:hypothetical protein